MNTICILDGGNLRYFPYEIDYKKLYIYITDILGTDKDKVFYIGALPTGRYYNIYDWVGNDFIDIDIFNEWINEYENVCNSPVDFRNSMDTYRVRLTSTDDIEILREKELSDIQQIKKQLNFMLFLRSIGYQLELTPLKYLKGNDDKIKRKGDSDIRIVVKIFDMVDDIQKIILISGDGDFLSLLKKMRTLNKNVVIMGYKSKDRATNRTAKEIVSFAGGSFRNLADSGVRAKIEFHRKNN